MVTFADPSRFSHVTPSGEQRVVRVNTTGAAGDGGARLLKAGASLLGDINKAIITKEDADRQYALDGAEIEAQIALSAEANAYNEDPDFATIGERSTKSINDKINKIAETIVVPRDRELFIQRQKVNIAKTNEHLRAVAFTKERDFNRGQVDNQLAELRNLALTDDMGTASELVSRRLESAVAKGYFGAEEAESAKRQWQVSAASGRLSMLPPEQQLDALKAPWANNLPADERAKLMKAAEEQLIIGKAQAFSDGLMSRNVTLDAGLNEIQKKIKDPDERQAAEERFKLEYTTNKRAIEDNQDTLHERYALAIENGLTIEEIKTKHKGEWEKMRQSQRENLKAMEAQRNAPPASSDPAALDRVIELSANGRHDDVIKLIKNNSSAFSKADREQYLTQAMKGKAPTVLSDRETLLAKLPKNESKGLRDQLLVSMASWRNDFVQSQGKEPTQEQAEKQVDRLLMKYDRDPKGWGFGDTKPVWKYQHEEQMKALEAVHKQELKEEDPENFDATERYVRSRGMKVDRYQFEDVYKTQQLVTSIKRRDPEGYKDVLDYFNPGRDIPGATEVTPSHSEFLRAYNMILERRSAAK